MIRRQLGDSGIEVSLVGLGCNNFGYMTAPAVASVVHRALDLGVTLFDTADVYGLGVSEQNLGKALGSRRRDVVIATKFGMPMAEGEAGASARHVIAACEASLRRLGTDWIDLYQLHRADPHTPLEETLRALADLMKAGKVRAIGCSNLPASQVIDAQRITRTVGIPAFITAQDEYSLVERGVERELIPALLAHGMSLLPYFPLASGLLTGKYQRGVTPPGTRLAGMQALADKYMTDSNWRIVAALTEFAAARGHTLLDLAFAWLSARRPVESIIAGATRASQIEANVKAADWALTRSDVAAIDSISAQAHS
jgi:aryl-alcohol dehydrogenase-like predicted oxidoreductase